MYAFYIFGNWNCTVEEFVEGGTPPFKEIYNNEVDIPSLKDSVQ